MSLNRVGYHLVSVLSLRESRPERDRTASGRQLRSSAQNYGHGLRRFLLDSPVGRSRTATVPDNALPPCRRAVCGAVADPRATRTTQAEPRARRPASGRTEAGSVLENRTTADHLKAPRDEMQSSRKGDEL